MFINCPRSKFAAISRVGVVFWRILLDNIDFTSLVAAAVTYEKR